MFGYFTFLILEKIKDISDKMTEDDENKHIPDKAEKFIKAVVYLVFVALAFYCLFNVQE